MSDASERRVPVVLWPFYALWRLLTLILGLTGRIVAGVLGLVLIAVGVLVSATVIGAPIGVPLAVLGLLLLLRALF